MLPPTVRQVKTLIWVYFWMLILEGAMRKWVLPMLSDPLLLMRDPVVLLIYMQALRGKFFPQHWLVKITIGLGCVTFLWGCAHIFDGDYKTLIVTAYGVRTYFLHLPLIFIMAHVFKREDMVKVGKWCLLISIPMAFLMVAQYKVGGDHWLNKATTGDDGQQLTAAMGHIRPPGTFSFISGPCMFYPLVTVFLVYGIMNPKAYPKWLILGAAACTALILPISGSRTLVLSCGLVVAFAVPILLRIPQYAPRFFIWGGVILMAGLTLLALPVGQEALESFAARWESATESEGNGKGASSSIANRMGGGFTEVFTLLDYVPFAGYGIGAGTNVGVKLNTGGVGFMYGESEWTRNVMEAGPVLGFTYIGFRVMFAFYLLRLAWARMQLQDPLPWLLMAASFIHLIMGQTSQPTALGFMVFIAGLSMCSVDVMQRRAPSSNRLLWLKRRLRLQEAMGH